MIYHNNIVLRLFLFFIPILELLSAWVPTERSQPCWILFSNDDVSIHITTIRMSHVIDLHSR